VAGEEDIDRMRDPKQSTKPSRRGFKEGDTDAYGEGNLESASLGCKQPVNLSSKKNLSTCVGGYVGNAGNGGNEELDGPVPF
jgi:hypothetical protein